MELLSTLLGSVLGLFSDFSRDWENNDFRVTIFKLLLSWIIVSGTAIHLAWRSYGSTVNGLYYRQGMGGQNVGAAEYPTRFPMWGGSCAESLKTQQ
ncbi:T-cell leukemia translocation-altered gene protein [Engystomops pustulosus]|uniref:T-cell leukemia translocation-altered gene protein n=1 Tax=Engystomops pustulosus TaxID=76066 RepID=UPI003AFB0376